MTLKKEKMKNACRDYDRDISRRSQEVKVKLLEIEKDAMRRKLAIVNSYAKELEENLDDLVKKSVEVDNLSKLWESYFLRILATVLNETLRDVEPCSQLTWWLRSIRLRKS